MAYKRKRTYKTKRYSKKRYAKKTTRVSPRVKSYVKREIARQAENKIVATTSDGSTVLNYITDAQFRYLNIPLSQGTGQGQRVGNAIRLKKAMLRISLWCSNAVANTTIPKYFDIYIVKLKMANDGVTTAEANVFLQLGNTSTSYGGDPLDGMRTVNNDVWTYCYHKRVLMINSTDVTNQNGYAGRSSINLSINCTKWLKKIQKYNDTTSSPTNDNLFLAIGATFADLSVRAQQVIGYYDSQFEYQYEDA